MVDFAKVIQAQRKAERKKSFSDAICQVDYSLKSIINKASRKFDRKSTVVPITDSIPDTKTIQMVEDSEKNRVMSSLKEYVGPLLKKNYTTEIPGGEIISKNAKNDYVNKLDFTPQFESWEAYLHTMTKCQKCQNRVFSGVVNEFKGQKKSAPIDVLFVSDRPRDFDMDSYSEDGEVTDLSRWESSTAHCFSGEKGEMVQRMIQKMNLSSEKSAMSLVVKCVGKQSNHNELKNECISHLLHEIYFLRPRVIVTFGAWCSEVLRGKSDKLSSIHGQLFPLELQNAEELINSMVVPLFHPDLLFINNDMKKTTWMDMQKIMSYLSA